jgi:glutamate-5-semialdehyde dehydrogenase
MTDLETCGQRAREASQKLKRATTAQKNAALHAAAAALRQRERRILDANAEDCAAHRDLPPAAQDRLRLDAERLAGIVHGIERVADLPDPVGAVIAGWSVPNGLRFERVRVPLGVIGVIYESRPNVTADAAVLCLKAGNACLLRPGSECFATAGAMVEALAQGFSEAGLPPAAVQMVPSADRALVGEMLQLDRFLDVIIPRGGKSLIARVRVESRVPVLAHLDGNCHVYVDGSANLEMAIAVTLNAKMRRTGICGAAETLLVDRACAATHLTPLVQALLDAGCALRGDPTAQAADPRVTPATDDDWATEYLDAIMAVKVVDGVTAAVEHIEHYGSHHTEAIIADDGRAVQAFFAGVDSAIVLHNASTQFADGGEFGMGAEIGIATGRLHARGPVGLEQLTTYKYQVYGDGQVRQP